MANSNFVVHNGLQVGSTTIFAGNGDIVTGGNVTSTNSTAAASTSIVKYLLQLPINLGSDAWYNLGTFSAASGSGDGERLEITIHAGQGFTASPASLAKDVIQVRILNGANPNISANYYSEGTASAISDVYCVASGGVTGGTGTSWDIYVYSKTSIGKGFMDVKLSNSANFTPINTSSTPPLPSGNANVLVSSNKFITSTSNVVITSGNLYVGGNIFQKGSQVATTVGNGLITNTFTAGGSSATFTLTNTPQDIDQVSVWWDGVYQPKTSAFTLSTNQITFTEIPPAGSIIEVKILAGTGAQRLSTLSDINFSTSPTDGQFLSYNSSTQKWVPATSATASSVKTTALTYAVTFGGL
jgi:hypothetical protein